jgi:hypothetical protein
MSDFWWLPKNLTRKDLLVGVGHHKEVADNEDVPPLDSWWRSLDRNGDPSNDIQYYPITSLNKWKSACNNTNVYRTLTIFNGDTKGAILLGPFLIDIDNFRWDSDKGGYKEDLDAAQDVTRKAITFLSQNWEISSRDMRIFFSGRKGFNIEICPRALGISGSIDNQVEISAKKLEEIIGTIITNKASKSNTVIDRIYGNRFGYRLKHPYIRLHDSVNKWICGDGKIITRRKIEITSKELRTKTAAEITLESERLVPLA